MSWTDVFPVMDDSMLDAYRDKASKQEKQRIAQLFEVESIHNQTPCTHVVATSLFWKPADKDDQEYPLPTKDLIQNPEKYGLSSRFKNPWKHYVEPVFDATRHPGRLSSGDPIIL